jgi:hypothetical protein
MDSTEKLIGKLLLAWLNVICTGLTSPQELHQVHTSPSPPLRRAKKAHSHAETLLLSGRSHRPHMQGVCPTS